MRLTFDSGRDFVFMVGACLIVLIEISIVLLSDSYGEINHGGHYEQ